MRHSFRFTLAGPRASVPQSPRHRSRFLRALDRCVRSIERLLLLLPVFVFCSIASVGTTRAEPWVRTYAGEGGYTARSVQASPDGGYVIAGEGPEGMWVLKLDASGNAGWTKAYVDVVVTSMVAASDGGYLIGGTRYSYTDASPDAFLMKLDAAGEAVWYKAYDAGLGEELGSVGLSADGGYLMVGGNWGTSGGGWVAKVDSAGNLVWQRQYRVSGYTYLRSAKQTPDSGYVVAGTTQVDGVTAGLVMKLGASGNLIWQRSYRGGAINAVEPTGYAGFVVVGGSWLAELDASGDIVWQRRYEGVYFDSVRPTGNHGYLLKGLVWGNWMDAVLLNVDANGEILWVRTYGGAGGDGIGGFQVTADGGYVLVGGYGVPGASHGSAWMLKAEADGQVSDCPPTRTLNLVASGANVSAVAGGVTESAYTAVAMPSAVGRTDPRGTLQRQCPFTGLNPSGTYQGLWWNSPAESESGWGINFAHQGEVIFVTWYTYDPGGRAWWLSMTASQYKVDTFSGALYRTTGPPFAADPFDPSLVTRTWVGSGVLAFSDANNGSFTYDIDGVTQTKSITRQQFDRLPTCVWGAEANLALATNYQDLWWSLNGTESGWGVNFAHQGDVVFATWYTYDFDGAPLWLSATAFRTGPATYGGTLLRTTGPPFNAVPFDPKAVTRTPVGTLALAFANGNFGSFSYTVTLPGHTPVMQTKQITRQVFRSPGTVCQ